jgi:radical SAM protein with 4Fe4S-binding SPASM domain
LNGNKKNCLCRAEDFLIGPEGDIYRCHRDLYDGSGELGNILNITYEVKDDFIPCSNYGLCNPCDVKLKLSKDLITSKCSVEIKEK